MKQLKLVNVRKMIPLAIVGAVALVPVAAALATAGSGFKERTVVARGTLEDQFKIKFRKSSEPGDVVVQKFVLAPGGHSGWHYHPGPADVTVQLGQLTLDQNNCSSTTYSGGKVAVEPTDVVHRVRNLGATDLEFWVTFIDIPVGSPQRVEPENVDPGWAPPDC